MQGMKRTDMSRQNSNGKRSGIAAGLMLAGAVCVLALPSAVLAISTGITEPPAQSPQQSEAMRAIQPRVDANLAEAISLRMVPKGQAFSFTPAGTATRPDRSITVAVRVDAESARAISVGKPVEAKSSLAGPSMLRLSPTAFNLGVSRGYQAFGQSGSVVPEIRKIDMPDLSAFRPGTPGASDQGRFRTRLSVDDRESTGRAPRTFDTAGQTVDLGGSYRVTGNLNVTAGVRYSPDRDRLTPLTDGKQDSQAVYVGTQFRF
jgi:hypothetical protein